jgi:hypothetical protein
MKMQSLLIVTLHVLAWCMHNNHHSIQSVDFSTRIKVACMLFECSFLVPMHIGLIHFIVHACGGGRLGTYGRHDPACSHRGVDLYVDRY